MHPYPKTVYMKDISAAYRACSEGCLHASVDQESVPMCSLPSRFAARVCSQRRSKSCSKVEVEAGPGLDTIGILRVLDWKSKRVRTNSEQEEWLTLDKG